MSFTAADVITEVREQVQDTLLVGSDYRYSDAFLLRKLDLALRSMVTVRPDLFAAVATMTCITGSLQTLPATSVRLMDVLRNQAGGAVKEVNQETMDLFVPTWPATTPATPATNWMRYPRIPNTFFLYPPATAGDTITVAYASSVPVTTTATVIPLQDAYLATVVFGTVWLVEAIDAEHAESGRAAQFKAAFDAGLASGLATRAVTDTDAAGTAGTK